MKRKPLTSPASITQRNKTDLSSEKPVKTAIVANITTMIDPASPSSPSMIFMALVTPTTQRIDNGIPSHPSEISHSENAPVPDECPKRDDNRGNEDL